LDGRTGRTVGCSGGDESCFFAESRGLGPPRNRFVPSSPDSVTFRLQVGGRFPTIDVVKCRAADSTGRKEDKWIAKRF
jgi:hypothetical protein